MAVKMQKILLTQPNYVWLDRRTIRYIPYTLCLLKAALNREKKYDVRVFDPNFNNLQEEDVVTTLKKMNPDLVGISSMSTEFLDTAKLMASLVRKALPDAVIVFGGVIPTVLIEEAMKIREVDYWVMGEGEYSLGKLIDELQKESSNLDDIEGLAYWNGDKQTINEMTFITDLDKVPFPDYAEIIVGIDGQTATLHDYGNIKLKYTYSELPRQYPYAVSITSRGCPYKCIFCAGRTVSGKNVRLRSADNVLSEIDYLYKLGIREIVFLDDHFLADRKRAFDIMEGIFQMKYGLTWKCANVTAWRLDAEILEMMYKSGCNFLILSPESGNQEVLSRIIKKPLKLDKLIEVVNIAKGIGFDVIVNFIIGFPGETWDQIRDSIRFAEGLNVDMVNFHIATPLPKTELMEIALRDKLLPEDYIEDFSKYAGFGKGLITTKEFTPFELEILRSFEWDRINFSTEKRKHAIARLNGITMSELEEWRKNTRRNRGVSNLVSNIKISGV